MWEGVRQRIAESLDMSWTNDLVDFARQHALQNQGPRPNLLRQVRHK